MVLHFRTNYFSQNSLHSRRLTRDQSPAFFMPFSCGIGAHALWGKGFFIITRKCGSKKEENHYGIFQVIALGAGLGIWGAINLLEGYGNDNPGAKSQGMKQLMAGGGVALIGVVLVPLLSGLFG